MIVLSPDESITNPLFVPELFQCILDCLATPAYHDELVPGAEGRQALAVLARTCRAFSEPSLDTLWRQLDSLGPLLRCCGIQLPLQEVTDPHLIQCDQLISDPKIPPSPAQRAIIDRYSHRIWGLTLSTLCRTWDVLPKHFWQFMGFEPSFLLPNLRRLSWKFDQTRFGGISVPLIYIRGLLCPKLTSLDVTLPGEKQEGSLASFFDTFSRLRPDLKSIQFSFDEGPRRVLVATAHVLSRSICNYTSLERLELFAPIDGASGRHLASLSTLKTLSLTLDPQIIQPHEIYFSTMEAPFRNVQEIRFITWDFHLVTGLLRGLNQTFHTLELYLHVQPTPESVSAFFTRLITLRFPHTDTLRSFYLILGRETPCLLSGSPYSNDPDGPLNHCFSYDTFSPLGSFISLRELVIDMNHQTSLDDNDLANLARSWPLLEVLHLDCLPGEYRRPVTKSVTLNGLLSLLTSCPKLRGLSLSLDATKVPVEAGAVIRNSAVKLLRLKNSLIDHPRLVAEFLFEHFPNVLLDAQITRNLPRDSDYRKQLLQEPWNEVKSMLRRDRDLVRASRKGHSSEADT